MLLRSVRAPPTLLLQRQRRRDTRAALFLFRRRINAPLVWPGLLPA